MKKYRPDIHRKFAKEACEDCGAGEGRLEVHHLDRDPENNHPSNLRTLCTRCHGAAHRKLNGNRTSTVQFRASPEEKAILIALSGGNMTEYIRERVFGSSGSSGTGQAGRRPQPTKAAVAPNPPDKERGPQGTSSDGFGTPPQDIAPSPEQSPAPSEAADTEDAYEARVKELAKTMPRSVAERFARQ